MFSFTTALVSDIGYAIKLKSWHLGHGPREASVVSVSSACLPAYSVVAITKSQMLHDTRTPVRLVA